jgi:hypothetical protein
MFFSLALYDIRKTTYLGYNDIASHLFQYIFQEVGIF